MIVDAATERSPPIIGSIGINNSLRSSEYLPKSGNRP